MDNASYDAAVADQVATALQESGKSVRETALSTGIPYTTLDRKLKGAPFHVNELRRIGLMLGRETASFLPDVSGAAKKNPAA